MLQQEITIRLPDAGWSLPDADRLQLEDFAWLAAMVHGADAAVIVLEQEGGLAPAGSAGLDAEDVLPVIDLCRRLRTGPETTVACDIAAPHGMVLGARSFAAAGLVSATGEVFGRLCILHRSPQGGLAPDVRRALGLLAGLIADRLAQQRRDAEQRAASRRAARTERMLHLVAEAGSVTDALTNMLSELCTHHGAAIGRIWRLASPGDQMQEISRFNSEDLDAQSYYRRLPAAPVMWGNSMTADAIRRNEPHGFSYAEVENPGRYVLMPAAVQSGLRCQVSYPIWVQDERFGVSLAFKTDRQDLGRSSRTSARWPTPSGRPCSAR